MEDLIVIILTLIVAVAGALGQRKKKKQPVSEGEAEPGTSDSFWDMLQGEEEAIDPRFAWAEPEEVVEEKFENDMEEGVSTEDPDYKFTAEAEGGSFLERTQIKTRSKNGVKRRLKEDFTLRKAVIFSEILNRKYF